MQILVVEDEPKVGNALREGLEAEGYEVILAPTGEAGFFHASSRAFDLIILDVMLPGRDGIEVLSTLRKQGLKIEYLAQNQGRVVSREMLVRDVWKETGRATPLDNLVVQ